MIATGDLEILLRDFQKVAALSEIDLPPASLSVELLQAPHIPPHHLPKRKMAVYIFLWKNVCLKVGKAGPKSEARYTSQHYNPSSSKSNLSRSLLGSKLQLGLSDLVDASVGNWVKGNVDRADFLLDESEGIPILNLLESFLQCRLNPMFEGFESQRAVRTTEAS